MIRRTYTAALLKSASLGERQIRVIASDPTPDRAGDIMVPSGCDLASYRRNPVVLANHDPGKPLGTADVQVKSNRVEALITFAPAKASQTADEFCALAKAGVLSAVSVGFNPIDSEPIGGAGRRYNEWELLELSVVSVPANPNAVVLERSWEPHRRASGIAWWPRKLTPQERREYEQRKKIHAAGLRRLSHEAFLAWLNMKFDGLNKREALRAYLELTATMTRHERFLLRKEQSDFAWCRDRIEAIRASVRGEIARTVSKIFDPVSYDAAEWCARVRAADEARIASALKNWRS